MNKTCTLCEQDKQLIEFERALNMKDGYRNQCTKCRSAKRKQHSQSSKIKAIEYLGGECMKCEGKFIPAVFDFHHRDPSAKENDLTNMLKNNWEKAKKELDKCDLLCSNCHRITHEELKGEVNG